MTLSNNKCISGIKQTITKVQGKLDCTGNPKKEALELYIVVGILSAIIFFMIYGFSILNPCYVDWLLSGGDLSQHYLGWKAYRASKWTFPFGLMDQLSYPNYSSIIFTDSIPLFAVFFKLLSPILPANFQYFGWWGLLCFVLQGIMAVRILKNFTDNKVSLVISGLIIVLTPVIFQRMFAHTALASQWILLFGLEPLFTYKKNYSESRKIYLIVGLMAFFGSFVHIYYILFGGLILVGICLLDIMYNKRAGRTFILLGEYIGIGIVSVYLLGGLQVINSSMAANGLGEFSFNLNGYFNSQGHSSILLPLKNGTDKQYEGFSYIGVANIILICLALVSLFSSGKAKEFIKRNYKYLIAIFVVVLVSTFIALSPKVTFNDKVLFEIKFPEASRDMKYMGIKKVFSMPIGLIIKGLWSIFRATGRIAWLGMYILILCDFILFYKFFNKKIIPYVVGILFALHVYDIHDYLSEIHNRFAYKKLYENPINYDDFKVFTENKDFKHVKYLYYPGKDLNLVFGITDWALDNKLTVNKYYFARTFEKNEIDFDNLSDDTLYIVPLTKGMDIKIIPNYEKFHLYKFDNIIVGITKKLPNKDEFFINDNLVNTCKYEQTSLKGFKIDSNGETSGPHWDLPKGNYKISLTGTDLTNSNEIKVSSKSREVYHDYTINKKTSELIELEFSLDEDVYNFELILNNLSDDRIYLDTLKVQLIN